MMSWNIEIAESSREELLRKVRTIALSKQIAYPRNSDAHVALGEVAAWIEGAMDEILESKKPEPEPVPKESTLKFPEWRDVPIDNSPAGPAVACVVGPWRCEVAPQENGNYYAIVWGANGMPPHVGKKVESAGVGKQWCEKKIARLARRAEVLSKFL